MSLQQRWIPMIWPELHQTHPFLALPSDVTHTQLFRSLWCITRGDLSWNLSLHRTKCYVMCFVGSSLRFRLLNFVQPTILSYAEYFCSKFTEMCTIGKGETEAWAYEADMAPTDGIYLCCRKRQKSPQGPINRKSWKKMYSSPNLVASLH